MWPTFHQLLAVLTCMPSCIQLTCTGGAVWLAVIAHHSKQVRWGHEGLRGHTPHKANGLIPGVKPYAFKPVCRMIESDMNSSKENIIRLPVIMLSVTEVMLDNQTEKLNSSRNSPLGWRRENINYSTLTSLHVPSKSKRWVRNSEVEKIWQNLWWMQQWAPSIRPQHK